MNKSTLFTPPPAVIDPLSLRPVDAAKALGVSERLLWTWTREHWVPHVRIGKVVLYPVAELQRWLADNTTRASEACPPAEVEKSTERVAVE